MGKNYEHLSVEERALIQCKLELGCKLRAIARSLQRAPLLAACSAHHPPSAVNSSAVAGVALAVRCQQCAFAPVALTVTGVKRLKDALTYWPVNPAKNAA